MNCTTTFNIDGTDNKKVNLVAVDKSATNLTFAITIVAATTAGSETIVTNQTFNGANPKAFSVTFTNQVLRITGMDYNNGGGGPATTSGGAVATADAAPAGH